MLIELPCPPKSRGDERAASRVAAVAPLVAGLAAVDINTVFARSSAPAKASPAGAEFETQPQRPPGGFLAELEQEVRSRPTQSEPDREALARNARLANIACRAVVDYWTQLVEHLNALNPMSAGRYVFDGRTALERLPAHSFRVLPKLRVSHTGEEHFEAVTLCWRVGTSDRLKLIKEFPAEIEKLKSRLSFGGINACESQSRDPVTGRHRGMQFEFVTELNASVSITPVHDSGIVRLTFLNLDAFERIEAELPAFAMRPTELDELARWICGRPNGLLKHAQNIVRHEP